MNKIKIIVDTREQSGYFFETFEDVIVHHEGLRTGDYSLVGCSDPEIHGQTICIERKSLADLFGTMGNGRNRFLGEIGRMLRFDFSAIVIEGTFKDIMDNPPQMSSMRPNAVIGSLVSIATRYNIQVYACHDRVDAEFVTYHLLRRFLIDNKAFKEI